MFSDTALERINDDVDMLENIYADDVVVHHVGKVSVTLFHQIEVRLTVSEYPGDAELALWNVDLVRTPRCDFDEADFDSIVVSVDEMVELLGADASAGDLVNAAANALSGAGHARVPPPLPKPAPKTSRKGKDGSKGSTTAPPERDTEELDVTVVPSRAVTSALEWPGRILVGPVLKDRRSAFQARLYEVKDLSDIDTAIYHITRDAHIASAAHPVIRAWRFTIGGPSSSGDATKLAIGCDDDGEHGASERLLFLLEVAKVDGWLLFVTRWFGGTLLGPSRFRHISAVATELLQVHGLAKVGKEPKGKGSK